MTHWRSMRKDITKNPNYKSIEQLIEIRKRGDQLTGLHVIDLRNKTTQMIDNAQELDLRLLQSYFGIVINQINFLDNTPQKEEFFDLWYKAWNLYQNDPEFFKWHTTTLGELSGYGDLIDSRLFVITAQEADKHLPSLNTVTDKDLPNFISMFKIANATQNPALRNKYRAKLLEASKKALPQEQYNQIKQQIDSIN